MTMKIISDEPLNTYVKKSRSVRILGHTTSIRLENKYWEILDEMAKKESITRGVLISKIYEEVTDSGIEINNFSSVLRIICVIFLEENLKKNHQPIDTS
ncbi:ribbon-helix-helix domain-containing protein [Vibrio chagasii]|uniref:ribbon-helix-helix domain-containing protein n=1 Tax=Vibrio chagasii TaxID=170679 RepID=UPI0031F32DA8